MTANPLQLREPVNVPDALARDRLVRRLRRMRGEAVQQKRDIEHWNRVHPREPAMDVAFEVAVIAWCDGEGEFPQPPRAELDRNTLNRKGE